MKIKILLIILILLSSISILFATNGKPVKKSKNYQVFVSKDKDSSLQKLKIIAKMKGTIEKAKKIILGVDNYSNFMPRIKKSIIFDKKDKCILTYTQMNAPIISDRDYVLKLCVTHENNKSLRIAWNTIENKKYPVNKNYVRITKNHGFWIIKKIDNENIKLIYSFVIDPKTSAPDFMINTANKKTIVKIIKAVEKEINKL